jgi:hypothetical protein
MRSSLARLPRASSRGPESEGNGNARILQPAVAQGDIGGQAGRVDSKVDAAIKATAERGAESEAVSKVKRGATAAPEPAGQAGPAPAHSLGMSVHLSTDMPTTVDALGYAPFAHAIA